MLKIENENMTTWKVLWFDTTDTPTDEMLTLGYISIENGKTEFTAANELFTPNHDFGYGKGTVR